MHHLGRARHLSCAASLSSSSSSSSSLKSSAILRSLKILIVDGYAVKSRAEFVDKGLPLASLLYSKMLQRQAPPRVKISFETICPCDPGFKMPSPRDLEHFDGCAFTGSSYSVYDSHQDVTNQINLFNLVSDARVSLFGSCWGLQVAATALGGSVAANPNGREVGVGRKIALTESGMGHSLYSGKKRVFEAFMSHSDEVTRLPRGALLLSSNDHTRVQAMGVVRHGVESWFVQYHPEYDLGYFSALIATRRERMVSMGFFADGGAVDAYCRDLGELARDHSRKDLAWKYGIDLEDMMDPDVRETEPRNWLRYLLTHAG